MTGRVERRAPEREPVDERPRAVPALRLHAVGLQQRAQRLDRVAAAAHAQAGDGGGGGVEGGERVVPAAAQRGLDGLGAGVAGHDRYDAAGFRARAELGDQGCRVVQVAEDAVAQDRVEAPACGGILCVLACGLQEGDVLACLGGLGFQARAGAVQHRRRRVEHGDVVARGGEGERLVARAAAHVEDRGRGRRQVLEQLVVQHVGAHAALHRGVGVVDEARRQGRVGPGCGVGRVGRVIAHGVRVGRAVRGRGGGGS